MINEKMQMEERMTFDDNKNKIWHYSGKISIHKNQMIIVNFKCKVSKFDNKE